MGEQEKNNSFIGAGNEAVNDWLREVRFKKKRFGGLDEADVWKKIGELNRLYEKMLIAERTRYHLLLQSSQGASQTEPQQDGGSSDE